MTRLENVIEQVKIARMGENKPWIFDDDGNVKDDVLCCEVLDILNELKEYEINVTDEWIDNFKYNNNLNGGNTYNWNSNISNDLNFDYIENNNEVIMLIKVHLFGDIRCGYSDYFVVKFDDVCQFYELDSVTQTKNIGNNMVAFLDVFREEYNVYDYEKGYDIGYFYALELSDLLEEIKK